MCSRRRAGKAFAPFLTDAAETAGTYYAVVPVGAIGGRSPSVDMTA